MTIYKNLEEALDSYSEGYVSSRTIGNSGFISKFEINAQEYLQYAMDDLKNAHTTHGLINAVSNIKRAQDCRLDTILSFWGMYEYTKVRNFRVHHKLEILKDMGIIAPSLLRKINKYRNGAEHDYIKPDREKVEDFCETVELFLGYTDNFLRDKFDGEIEKDNYYDFMRLSFARDNSEFSFEIIEGKETKRTQTIKVKLSEENAGTYTAAIKWWYKILNN